MSIIAYFVPKKLSKIENYATSFFAYAYGATVDIILDLHYDLYGYFEKGFQWLGLFSIFLYFPSISVLFLNFYPVKSHAPKKIIYILCWTVFSIAFEWFCLYTKFLYYNGWKLWYSAAMYPFIFLSLIINLKIVRKLLKAHLK